MPEKLTGPQNDTITPTSKFIYPENLVQCFIS